VRDVAVGSGKLAVAFRLEEGTMIWVLRIGGGLVAVLLLAVLVLLAMGRRSGAGHVQATAEIHATPEQIWPWMNDAAKLKQWVSWLVEVRGDAAGSRAVGSQTVLVMRDENNGGHLMEIRSTVTEAEPPSKLAVTLSAEGGFTGHQQYRLTRLANGNTRVEIEAQWDFAIWMAKLFEPLITPSAQKKMVGDVARLKAGVEAASAAATQAEVTPATR
jgi:uncharacterized protein YndB with AHSA1/START domain